nr:EutP/PduV family microcompartment system protein [Escherichia coli]
MTDFGGKTSIFSHPVYLFLRKFSLQDSRGGSDRSDGRCLLFRQQAGISALKQELEVKTPYRAMNHPVIGVVTKADLASMEQISLVKSWLREAGAHNVLVTSAVNNNGVTELFALLHTEEGCC